MDKVNPVKCRPTRRALDAAMAAVMVSLIPRDERYSVFNRWTHITAAPVMPGVGQFKKGVSNGE
ncbi:MAG: hypothetical protein EYC68_03635 [Chloroflexota bacterium]|nr:MAG: hypothetical protein EYC68_03635 [Chloroflexota bacterium]